MKTNNQTYQENAIFTLWEKPESYPHQSDFDFGQVTFWSNQATNIEDEEAMRQIKAELDNHEPGVWKGFALRVISKDAQGAKHVSMTNPFISSAPKTSISGKIEEYAQSYIDYIEQNPELMRQMENGFSLELIPLRTYSTSKYTTEFANKNPKNHVSMEKRVSAALRQGYALEHGDQQINRGILAFSGRVDIVEI